MIFSTTWTSLLLPSMWSLLPLSIKLFWSGNKCSDSVVDVSKLHWSRERLHINKNKTDTLFHHSPHDSSDEHQSLQEYIFIYFFISATSTSHKDARYYPPPSVRGALFRRDAIHSASDPQKKNKNQNEPLVILTSLTLPSTLSSISQMDSSRLLIQSAAPHLAKQHTPTRIRKDILVAVCYFHLFFYSFG